MPYANSHVIPALIRHFHETKDNSAVPVKTRVSEQPRREFIFVADLAEACVSIMGRYKDVIRLIRYQCNCISMSVAVKMSRLPNLISRVIGFTDKIEFDASKPDGACRKLLKAGLIHRLGGDIRLAWKMA